MFNHETRVDEILNKRVGPKGQGTSLPPSPRTAEGGGGDKLVWGDTSEKGSDMSVGRVTSPRGWYIRRVAS